MTTHDRLDGLGSLIGVVERNGADVVVKNVGLDDTVKKSASDESEFTIDGCCGSTNIVPALARVVRKSWVGVLEEGDSNKPVVYPEVWNEVPDSHVVKSVCLAKHDKDSGGDGDTEITQQDQFGIFSFIKRTGWVEVTDGPETVDLTLSTTLMLTLMVVVTGDVHE